VEFIENEQRRHARIFARGRPGQGTKLKVRSVQVDQIEIVTDRQPSGAGQHLVDGKVRIVQTITETRIRFDWKEAEGRIERPLNLQPLTIALDLSAVESYGSSLPVDTKPCRPEHVRILVGIGRHDLRGVMKDVNVFRVPRRRRIAVQRRRAGYVTVGVTSRA